MEFLSFLRAAVTKHAFGAVQTKAYIHGARLLRTRLAARQSEDCLYLNVRTTSPLVIGTQRKEVLEPSDELGGDNPTQEEGEIFRTADDDISNPAKADKLPVIVYIHGGDYHDGAGGSRPFYAANALPVKGKVVLVTFNYRLGLMGHFTHPELSKEAEAERRPAVCGNYSILDQIAVLRWVQTNIAAFGGNPDNVTIMGSSAGGESVLYMMTSPLARGLFHKAISQSPASTPNSLMHLRAPFACWQASEDNGVDFASRVTGAGPGQLERLRNAPLRQLMNAYYIDGTTRPEPRQLFYPVVDGHVIPRPPIESFQFGEQAAVPLMVGNNADEGSLCYPVTYTRTRIRDALYPSPVRDAGKKAYGEDGAAALADMYDPTWRERGEDEYDGSPADCDFFTDRVFGQKVYWLASHHRRLLGQPTYVYVFAAAPPREGQTVGAFHGAEVPYAFGSRPWLCGGPEDKRLARAMPDYWSAFARSGDPNCTLRPQVLWPTFDALPGKERVIVLGHAIEATLMNRTEMYEIIHTHVRKVMSDLESMRKWQTARTKQEMEAAALPASGRGETAGDQPSTDQSSTEEIEMQAKTSTVQVSLDD